MRELALANGAKAEAAEVAGLGDDLHQMLGSLLADRYGASFDFPDGDAQAVAAARSDRDEAIRLLIAVAEQLEPDQEILGPLTQSLAGRLEDAGSQADRAASIQWGECLLTVRGLEEESVAFLHNLVGCALLDRSATVADLSPEADRD